jgi:hypothetical protein
MVEKPIVFFHLSGRLRLMPSLSRFKTSVKLAIDGLTRGCEFLVDMPCMSEKTINMDLTLLQT